MLPIQLAEDQVRKLMADAGNKLALIIDLPNQEVVRENGEKIGFEVDPFRKYGNFDIILEPTVPFLTRSRVLQPYPAPHAP